MNRGTFLLAIDPNNSSCNVIHARGSGLRLRVFCLDTDPFHPDDSEIHLYGTAGGRMYAFESIGITSDDTADVVEAIQWYTCYIGHPEIFITVEDPRPLKNIAI